MKFIFESNPVKLNLPSNVDYEWVIFKDLTGTIIPHDREKENIFLPLVYVGQLIEYTLVPNTITVPIEHPLAYIESLQKFLNILNIEKPSTADLTRSRFFERYNIPTKYKLIATKVLITNNTNIAYNDLIDAGYDASEGEWFVSYNDNVFVRGSVRLWTISSESLREPNDTITSNNGDYSKFNNMKGIRFVCII